MKIAIAQISSEPGQIGINQEKILEFIYKSREEKSDLVIFPELVLSGYLCLDLFLDVRFLEEIRKSLEIIAQNMPDHISALIGFPELSKNSGKIYNSVALISDKKIHKIFRKTHLPDYDLFYENRYFTRNLQKPEDSIMSINDIKIGVQVCEDLWDENYPEKITEDQKKAGVAVIINLSASPYRNNILAERQKRLKEKSRDFDLTMIYVNAVGSGDGYDGQITFDGRSMVYKNGEELLQAKSFEEDLVVFDTEEYSVDLVGAQNFVPLPEIRKEDKIFGETFYQKQAIILAMRDYHRRSSLGEIIIGLSGGVDSTLVTALAVEAFGADMVKCYGLPSRYSSDHSVSDSKKLAENLGVYFQEISIEPFFESYKQVFAKTWHKKISWENIQARIRGNILMGFANEKNGLVLSTTNKTEMALGYGTLYGDMCGGLSPISDLNKTSVYEMCHLINKISKNASEENSGKTIIPENILTKAPSAELSPDQTDEDGLGADYEILSPLVDELITQKNLENVGSLYEKFGKKLVDDIARRIRINEYKRRQSSPGIKLSEVAFGIGRRVSL